MLLLVPFLGFRVYFLLFASFLLFGLCYVYSFKV